MKQEKSRQSLHMGLPELSVAVPQDLVDETDITPSAMHCCVCHGPGPATTTGLAIVLDDRSPSCSEKLRHTTLRQSLDEMFPIVSGNCADPTGQDLTNGRHLRLLLLILQARIISCKDTRARENSSAPYSLHHARISSNSVRDTKKPPTTVVIIDCVS